MMDFSLFPARGAVPPPVPPKTPTATPDINPAVKSANIPKHKKVRPSLVKTISFDSLLNLYPNSRKSPPEQSPESPTPSAGERPLGPDTATQPATAAHPRENSNSTSALDPPPRVRRAKSGAKGGFVARRGEIRSGIETMVTVQEAYIDSRGYPRTSEEDEAYEEMAAVTLMLTVSVATIPGRPPIYQEPESSNSWRHGAPRGALIPSASPLLDTAAYTERPISPPASPPPPQTARPVTAGGKPPQVPPKPGAALQGIPPFPRPRSLAVPEKRPAVGKNARQVCGDSAARRQIELPRPGSVGSEIPPARWLKRRQSSASSTLPRGVRPPMAPKHLHSQIEWQRAVAMIASEEFDILDERDVEGLSRELSSLEARCRYLRETHRSLRDGRRTLHKRIITYLEPARSTIFSREGLLKQEEALAELDASIDDWHLKLEKVGTAPPLHCMDTTDPGWKANDRMARVKQKLLEHLAAALAAPSCECSPRGTPRGMGAHPATPERQKQGKSGARSR